MQKEAFLVVISVLEGRNFPSRPKHHLIIECKFDGELLATDPVEHVEAPNFTTELAWEMDRRALHQHKMQRTPVKLQCFAVDNSTMIRENIGYILLDLRGAQQKPKTSKWYNLLSSKYSRLKPAIKISMVLENDTSFKGFETKPGFKASDAPPRPVQPAGGKIEAILNSEEGYFQIGSNRSCEMFVLAVTLGSAFHLEQLIFGDKALPSVHSGFFFYYSLFGSDITNDPFHNLLSPDITPERASIRIRSTLETLRAYFTQMPQLKVHLCCGDQVLGTASIPFAPLFTKKQLSFIESEPIAIEGIYPLFPPLNLEYAKATQPEVSAAICLRRENVCAKGTVELAAASKIKRSPEAAPNEPPVRDIDPKPIPFPDLSENPKPSSPDFGSHLPANQSPMKSPLNTEDDAESIHSISHQTGSDLPKPNMESIKDDKAPSLTTTETHTDIPAPMQHYRFTLDLTSIATTKLRFPSNIFVKYSYPFFGSFSPVLTGVVEAKNNSEFRIPRSKCVFDFACPPRLLASTFRSFPITLEVWHRGKETNDEMLGVASLVLSKVLEADRIRFTSGEEQREKSGYRQTCHGTVPVVTPANDNLAVLNVVIVLEDFGVVVDQNVIRPTEFAQLSPKKSSAPIRSSRSPKKKQVEEDPRQSNEYKTALELELWKSQEKDNFTKRLKQMEMQHLKLLGEEFAKRDKERELLVAKQVSEYQALEKQLSNTINGLEKRERQVTAAEQELNRLREDAIREKERTIAEAKEASKRMKEDCVHQVQLEREKRSVLEDYNKKLLRQVNELELKYSSLMSQFCEFKKEQSNRPEVRLQAELNLARLEKTEVDRKLESAVKSKLHYKQQWGRTLKELAMMKKREQEAALANLKQQQHELETLKLRCMASDEKAAIASDHDKLKQIQDDLQSMKKSKAVNQLSSIAIESCPVKSLDNDELNERISRLIEERDTLLRTGVYSQNDRIITELDRQIKDEMMRQQN